MCKASHTREPEGKNRSSFVFILGDDDEEKSGIRRKPGKLEEPHERKETNESQNGWSQKSEQHVSVWWSREDVRALPQCFRVLTSLGASSPVERDTALIVLPCCPAGISGKSVLFRITLTRELRGLRAKESG